MKKLVYILVLLLSISAVQATNADFFAKTSNLRALFVNNPNNKTVEITPNLDVNKPVKVSLDLKKGHAYAIYTFGEYNRRNPSIYIINDTPIKHNEYTSSGSVYFQRVSKRINILYKKETLKNAIQILPGSSMLLTAKEDKTIELSLLYESKAKAPGKITIVEVTNPGELTALEKEDETLSDTYAAYSERNFSLSMAYPSFEQEQKMVDYMIDLTSSKNALTQEKNKISSLKTTQEQSKAYSELFYKARKISTLQSRLKFLKQDAIDLAMEEMKKDKNFPLELNTERYKQLSALIAQGFDELNSASDEAIARAEQALELQQLILLDNPALNFEQIIFGKYRLKNKVKDSHTMYLAAPHNNWSVQTSALKIGYTAEIGAINIKKENDYQTIYKPEKSYPVPDIKMHFDAEKFLFTMPDNKSHLQVHEYDLKNKKLTQVTKGSDDNLDYFDAAYLPNGNIIVNSNVGGNGVPCVHGRDQVGNLCVYDRETHNMRRLGFDQDCSWGPTMMNNGKVMYTRWEYTDLNHVYSRIVMSMNPDGTEQKALFGSGMMFPNATYDIQAIPNHPSEFVGIITGHHKNTRSGRLFLFDPAISRTSTDAMIHEFPYRERELVPFIKDQLVDNVWPQFLKPQAVDNKTFITIAKLRPEGLWGLYLVDIYDNLVLLAEYEGEGVTNPALVRKQYRPNIIPDKTDLSKKTATVFIQDIYQGVGLEGVPKGTIKQLRIHTYEFAYRASPSHVESQGIHSGWDMKTCLGIVDLNEDGSALFTIPANTPISIQPLDEKGRAVQWMRSWLTGMPGEVVSCVGCHEDLNQIPVPKSSMASKMEPLALTPPKGGVAPMSFDNHVQPMLDRKCIGCHNSKHKIDFTGGRKDKQGFSESYLNLHPHVYRQGNEAGMRVLTPYEYYANNSSLIQMLESGHYGVELDKDDWYALTNWIDYNVPDKGYFQIVDSQLFPNQYEHRIYLAKKYGNGIYSPWKEQTEDFKTYLASLPKSEPEIPSYTAPKFKQLSVKGFPFTAKKGEEKIITVNGVDFKFIKIPAGKFIMGENRANSNASPTRKAEVKREFWMSESELTNAQVRAIIPEHDSRYFDRQGMTRPDEGYPANEDNQVAVRISYIKAQELVSKMSEITKQNINLPSEVQWEWAARAGSDKDYWFSTTDSYGDFSPYENLADKQMTKLALKNIVTQWKPGTIEYKHNAYHPKDESVDDNTMLTSNPKDYTYKANGFGLYNMLGNVSEWTRSDNEGNVNEKIVKGGAWNTHPKDARVAPRRYYYPYQAPHNVGVRLIIEP